MFPKSDAQRQSLADSVKDILLFRSLDKVSIRGVPRLHLTIYFPTFRINERIIFRGRFTSQNGVFLALSTKRREQGCENIPDLEALFLQLYDEE